MTGPGTHPARPGYVAAVARAIVEHRTARVPLAVLRAAAIAYDASVLTDPLWRGEMAAALRELQASGTVSLSPALDRAGVPLLPEHAIRPSQVRPRTPRRARAWAAPLAAAESLTLSAGETEVLERVNDWLLQGGAAAEPVALRERAYELFGQEKRLDGLTQMRLYAQGIVTFEVLQVYTSPPPLAVRRAGPAPWVLVVENSATFASMRRALDELVLLVPGVAHALGDVAYGAGKLAPYAMASLAEERPGAAPYEQVLYFGDLDPDGVAIAEACVRNAQQAGLAPVRPADAFYRALLLAPPRTVGLPGQPLPSAGERVLVRPDGCWAAGVAAGIRELFSSGRVLRQEALPRPALRGVLLAATGSAPTRGSAGWQDLTHALGG